jgi:hypothetical protein
MFETSVTFLSTSLNITPVKQTFPAIPLW